MKILEQGQLPEDKIYVVQCRNCKTKIEFLRKEANEEYDPSGRSN